MKTIYRHLSDTVYLALPGAIDLSGNPTYEPSAAIPARVERRTKRVTSPITGDDVMSETQFVTMVDVPVDAAVWLPGSDPDEDTPLRPIRVDSAASFGGVTLRTVYL